MALIATCEDRHVLVSTTASKSKLNSAVDEICASVVDAHYFPSYEIILGQHARGRFDD